MFQKNRVVSGKAPFFEVGTFCMPQSISLTIGFWLGKFIWKGWVFNFNSFQLKHGTLVL